MVLLGAVGTGVVVSLWVVGYSGGCWREGRSSTMSTSIKVRVSMYVFFGGYVPDPYE